VKGDVIDESAEALAAFGATPEQIADMVSPVNNDVVIWIENKEIVEMFFRLTTQWYVSMAGLSGINYSSYEYLCKLYSVEDPVSMFEGIQTMEYAALRMMQKDKK
tara:strand:+ start:531 stop:845 length:315 start_codon:yes stop_codon:yes gene_type:complete